MQAKTHAWTWVWAFSEDCKHQLNCGLAQPPTLELNQMKQRSGWCTSSISKARAWLKSIDESVACRIFMARVKTICIFMILILFLTPHSQLLNEGGKQTLQTEGRQQLQTNFTQLDQNIQNLVNRWNLPGAQAAVVYNGTLVFEQSYGMADTALQIPVENESIFRIASLSKGITAAAIHTLVVNGDISLGDSMVSHIPRLMPSNLTGCAYPNHANGWSIANITIQNILNHRGGFAVAPPSTANVAERPTTSWHYEHDWIDDDSAWQGASNPCIDHITVAQEYDNGTLAPVAIETTIRETLRLPLSFQPGATYSYSNLGYRILGEIIESASGMGYEEYVKQFVLAPMGITNLQTGKSLPLQKAEGEVTYYDQGGGTFFSYFPLQAQNNPNNPLLNVSFGTLSSTPMPYGGSGPIEQLEASGGWISTAASFARFIAHLDGTLNHSGFNNSFNYFTTGAFSTTPPNAAGSGIFYNNNNPQSWWNNGAISGTSTRFVRNLVGGVPVTIVLLTNTNPSGTVNGSSWGQDRSAVMNTVFSTINYTGLECVLGETKQELGISCSCIPLEEIWHCPPPEETEWPQNDPNLNTDPALNPPSEGNTTEQDGTVVPSIGLVAMLSIIGLVAIIRRGRIEV
jgi:CubicO group peptidase (beta-lactamase class C family)